MAVRIRTTRIPFVNEVNSDGVATQLELNDAISTHLNEYHEDMPYTRFDNGIDYYWDADKNKYLSKQIFMVDFSDNDTTTHNIYMFQKKNIRCNYSYNYLPFNRNLHLDKIEISLDRAVSGDIIDVEDDSGNALYTIHVNNNKYTLIENVNLTINTSFRCYVNSITLRRPIVKLWFRLEF